MTSTLDEDEVLSALIAGIPKIVEIITTLPDKDRPRALEAAEKSYLRTAHTLGPVEIYRELSTAAAM